MMRCLFVISLMLITACKTSSSHLSESNFYSGEKWGYYWFGMNGVNNTASKAIDSFDPHKKTIILFRGWAIDKVENGKAVFTNYRDYGGPDLDLSDLWIEEDWNFAIYDWAQFSDEEEIKFAEAKIWTGSGPKQMRWKDQSGLWRPGPKRTVTELAADQLIKQLADFSGSDLIFMGHSIGAQLALSVAGEIQERSKGQSKLAKLIPQQVILTDPVSTNGAKDYLGKQWVGEKMNRIAKALYAQSQTISVYYQCSITAANPILLDENKPLKKTAVFIKRNLRDILVLNVEKRHRACKWKYLMSINDAWLQKGEGGYQRPGLASQSYHQLRQLKRAQLWLEESEPFEFITKSGPP